MWKGQERLMKWYLEDQCEKHDKSAFLGDLLLKFGLKNIRKKENQLFFQWIIGYDELVSENL